LKVYEDEKRKARHNSFGKWVIEYRQVAEMAKNTVSTHGLILEKPYSPQSSVLQ
jgi:hypothetical protein